MVERIKRVMLAVGVCFPVYLVLYTAWYVIERLWMPAERWFAGPALFGIGMAVTLRVAWMFARAAVRGGPVLAVPPEPAVVAPILPIVAGSADAAEVADAADPADAAEGKPEPIAADGRARPRRQPAVAGDLVPDRQLG